MLGWGKGERGGEGEEREREGGNGNGNGNGNGRNKLWLLSYLCGGLDLGRDWFHGVLPWDHDHYEGIC